MQISKDAALIVANQMVGEVNGQMDKVPINPQLYLTIGALGGIPPNGIMISSSQHDLDWFGDFLISVGIALKEKDES